MPRVNRFASYVVHGDPSAPLPSSTELTRQEPAATSLALQLQRQTMLPLDVISDFYSLR